MAFTLVHAVQALLLRPGDTRPGPQPGRRRRRSCEQAQWRGAREAAETSGTGEQAASPADEDRAESALSSVRRITRLRERTAAPPSPADRVSALGLGLGYAAVAVCCAAFTPWPSPQTLVELPLLVTLYALAYRTEFVSAGGSTVPTEPVLVGLLLATPVQSVPLAILVALLAGRVGAQEAGPRRRYLAARLISGWHCLGPVAVLWAFGVAPPAVARWRLYLLALLAQFAFDAASAAVRQRCLGVRPRALVAPLLWTFTVDALLAPLGLCVVIVSRDEPAAIVLLAAPVVLMRLLARDRNEQLEAAVALGTVFTAVQEEARIDALTGLANRRAWVEGVDQAGERLRQDPGLVAVALMADVDGLKRTNDTFGHDVGDELIQAVATVLADVAPDGAVVARLGGDEFGVLVVTRGARRLDERLLPDARTALRRHPGVAGVPLSASLGVAACPPAPSVLDAVTSADLAAAQDKIRRRAGRT